MIDSYELKALISLSTSDVVKPQSNPDHTQGNDETDVQHVHLITRVLMKGDCKMLPNFTQSLFILDHDILISIKLNLYLYPRILLYI